LFYKFQPNVVTRNNRLRVEEEQIFQSSSLDHWSFGVKVAFGKVKQEVVVHPKNFT
jgi:hypothetical protein